MAENSKPYSKKMRNDLAPGYVCSILAYNRITGTFTWRDRSDIIRGKNITGMFAGFVHKGHGYRVIKINNIGYLAHRLAYLMTVGTWPEYEIDHINGKRSDNRWKNLRSATFTEQARNAKDRKNASYKKGVFRQRSGRFGARIRVNKHVLYLGVTDTEEAAHELYRAAAEKYFGEFARRN